MKSRPAIPRQEFLSPRVSPKPESAGTGRLARHYDTATRETMWRCGERWSISREHPQYLAFGGFGFLGGDGASTSENIVETHSTTHTSRGSYPLFGILVSRPSRLQPRRGSRGCARPALAEF